ncbi:MULTISPECIES: aminotransferase-like domain-containing protein [Burkholderia]|uniref:GntR family transcriptional regulator n=1 Tax=Burkholderia savannae TaxID=1637837 RepID=A0ABR5TIN5_9BURK|nr:MULTISPECIES: PLP-dependent aminotransferase family protein [Burkholderia]AOJ69307.1 GntR family transcriptional regulator [Burkholderia savannae]AOJ81279.1 GntR family transcriptional regulator [Burkholderia savannae]AOK47489.1 GntR family transcriptional regulator [Burkholderia sp. MSMB617WGS]KGS06000.1 aminotransferase class-V family protein [Burkholderia sp. ABCPW 111]KVG47199.1 GntR family transcriptional regulator [Burkholderia sp. MSMB0265]
MKRYETLARTMAGDIRSGNIAAGTRMPSLRQLIAQHRVSQSTVFRAYYLLEQWGLIRARERSGYYVAHGAQASARANDGQPAPGGRIARAAAPAESRKVDISDLVFSVLEASTHPGIVPLGSAFASAHLFPLPRLAKSLAQATRLVSPRSTVVDLPPGSEQLRRQIALRYLGIGVPQPIDEIVVTDGALEALNLCLMAVTRPGDVVAVEAPGFYAALQAIERLDLRAVEIPVDPRTGLDLDALAAALDRHDVRACWFMTNFQNPTGVTLSVDKKKALVEMLAAREVPLIEDDVYGELHHGPDYPLPARAFDKHGLVMHCSSFSKTLAPGYRIGWASAGRFAEKVRRLKLMTTLSASTPAQVGIADYLEHGGYDRHLRKLRGALRGQMGRMNEALMRHLPPDVHWTLPDGGYFLWLAFPDAIDAMALHREAIGRGVSVAPGPLFSAAHAFERCVRINFGHPWSASVDDAIRIVGELVARPSVRKRR